MADPPVPEGAALRIPAHPAEPAPAPAMALLWVCALLLLALPGAAGERGHGGTGAGHGMDPRGNGDGAAAARPRRHHPSARRCLLAAAQVRLCGADHGPPAVLPREGRGEVQVPPGLREERQRVHRSHLSRQLHLVEDLHLLHRWVLGLGRAHPLQHLMPLHGSQLGGWVSSRPHPLHAVFPWTKTFVPSPWVLCLCPLLAST